MEASKLKKKNKKISKGKLKETIKNIICRPDPMFWPLVSDDHAKQIENALIKHKVSIPEFTKLHWSELKSLPKEQRPKPPKIEKVTGLLFGITTCVRAIESQNCAGVILDGEINPKILVQHVLDACFGAQVPVLCINGLRKICSDNFGVPTSCLGLDKNTTTIMNIRNAVDKIAQSNKKERNIVEEIKEEMDIDIKNEVEMTVESEKPFTYLYRKNKRSRVFTPPSKDIAEIRTESFVGQDFIEFTNKVEDKQKRSKTYMSMIVKRISNNANRKQ